MFFQRDVQYLTKVHCYLIIFYKTDLSLSWLPGTRVPSISDGRLNPLTSALIKPLNQPRSPVYANAAAFAQINQHKPSLTLAVLTYLITIKERRRRHNQIQPRFKFSNTPTRNDTLIKICVVCSVRHKNLFVRCTNF